MLLLIFATTSELMLTTNFFSLLALTNSSVSLLLSFCEVNAFLTDTLAACEYAQQTISLAFPTMLRHKFLKSLPSIVWAVSNVKAWLVLDISNPLTAVTS